MARYTKTTITQLSSNEQAAIDAINKNLTEIQEAIEDTVSRSGKTPTHMTHDLDLNGKKIINVPAPSGDNDLVRKIDVFSGIDEVRTMVQTAAYSAQSALESSQDALSAAATAIDKAGVASDKADIATQKAEIATNAANDPNVVAVGTDLLDEDSAIKGVNNNYTNINAVNANKTNIDTVAGDSTAINAVAADLENVDAILDDLEDIHSVGQNILNVNAVADNETNINAVNSNKTNIDAVAGNESDISTVAGIASDVSNVASNASDVSNVATNMSDVNDCATNMVAILDAPNQAQAAADSAALAYQYANDKINQTHITNCITYIPQDIKLELDSGTLTLKAGSKVYVPNGAGVFDTLIINSDLTYTYTTNEQTTICVKSDGSELFARKTTNCTSGAGATATAGYAYDTTTNKINWYNISGQKQSGDYSLPICLITTTGGAISSIDQIFNGFGYIGSTVFVLPGVKGLIPDGRNEDGSLKSIVVSQTSVAILDVPDISRADVAIFIKSDHTLLAWGRDGGNVVSLATKPAVAPITFCRAYIENENLWYHSYATTDWEVRDSSDEIVEICAVTTDANRRITDFRPKTVFQALDGSDKGTIAGFGMPSNKYIDLTLGVSGTEYIAPANGFFAWAMTATAEGQSFSLDYKGTGNSTWLLSSGAKSYANNDFIRMWLPVRKGEKVSTNYSGGTNSRFRFTYAEGEV